ncbi:MAG: hypothetical protein ACR2N4_01640 [Jatrophihabitans sp.]
MWRDCARAYRIVVDGESVGSVRPRRTLRAAVPAGTHTVQARVSTAGSKKYRFSASAGQEYTFEVRPNGSALTAFRQIFGSEYIRLTPTGPNVNGGWDQEVDRSPVVSARTLLYSGLVPGLLGALGGPFGATAGQRLLGIGLGLVAALLWTALVRSGRLRSRRRNTAAPGWHGALRLVLILLAALIGSLVLAPGPQPPVVFGVGLFFSCYVIAMIIAVYLQKWYRLASARAR